jgi:hypothetical protein
MKKKNFVLRFLILMMILFFTFTPQISSLSSENKKINNTIELDKNMDSIDIIVVQCFGNMAIKEVLKIPINKSLKFVEQLSLNITINQTSSMLTNLGFNVNEELLLQILNFNNKTLDQNQLKLKLDTNLLLNAFCRIRFFIVGRGPVLGTSTLPILPFALNIAGFFRGVGYVETFRGLAPNQPPLKGKLSGSYIGFLGIQVFTFIPGISGPIVYANGIAGITSWHFV